MKKIAEFLLKPKSNVGGSWKISDIAYFNCFNKLLKINLKKYFLIKIIIQKMSSIKICLFIFTFYILFQLNNSCAKIGETCSGTGPGIYCKTKTSPTQCSDVVLVNYPKPVSADIFLRTHYGQSILSFSLFLLIQSKRIKNHIKYLCRQIYIKGKSF